MIKPWSRRIEILITSKMTLFMMQVFTLPHLQLIQQYYSGLGVIGVVGILFDSERVIVVTLVLYLHLLPQENCLLLRNGVLVLLFGVNEGPFVLNYLWIVFPSDHLTHLVRSYIVLNACLWTSEKLCVWLSWIVDLA